MFSSSQDYIESYADPESFVRGVQLDNVFEKIYDEVTEDIFDMSNVRFFKEIEKKKNGGCLYYVMSSVS